MKIGIDLRMVNSSGIGTYSKNLIPLIIQAFPAVQFCLFGDVAEIEEFSWSHAKNVRVLHCQGPQITPAGQIGIWKAIGTTQINLFWSPHMHYPLLYRGPLLVTVHDVPLAIMNRPVRDFPKRLYIKMLLKQLQNRQIEVLCDSEYTRSVLLTHCRIDEDHVHTVPCGIDYDYFKSQQKKADIYPKPFLLYVGNVKPHKNLGRLLDAFQQIKDRIPHDLVVVGKKEGFITGDKNFLKRTEQFQNRIYFTGRINDELLMQYYANADVLVFPSIYEGFGFPPLEAMACGCPATVSNATSIPEVCNDAALYFDPLSSQDIADKIMMILSDSELRADLISKGNLNVLRYNWNEHAQKVAAVVAKYV